MEYQLSEFEVTHFTINKKKRYYVCLGTWSVTADIKQTPGGIWSILSSGSSLRLPQTSTSSHSCTLAKAVGSLDAVLLFKKQLSSPSEDKSDSRSESMDDMTETEDMKQSSLISSAIPLPFNLPDAEKFPLLYSSLPTYLGCNFYDRLLSEITRFYEGMEINFKCGNNTQGTLVALPAFRTLEKYEKKLKSKFFHH
jgi:hypothetical protein